MSKQSDFEKHCDSSVSSVRDTQERISKLYAGKKAKIVSSYNGQPHGSSKKKLTGKIVTIERISVDGWDCFIWAKGYNLAFRPNELEITQHGVEK